MSNMVAHAERELAMINEDPEFVEAYLNIVRIFAGMGHSGGSADVSRSVINALLEQENITPLTNDPDEWQHHGEDIWPEPGGIWQNLRCSKAFSRDGGKTYYMITDSIGHDGGQTIFVARDARQVKNEAAATS